MPRSVTPLGSVNWLPRDEDELERLYARHDALSDELGEVERRIFEMEDRRGDRETAELRADYYASVL